jgi:hypothetical protein
MKGDRMIVLASERLGTVVRVDPPALGDTDPVVLVQRDDLPASFPPLPYDLHELAISGLSAAA